MLTSPAERGLKELGASLRVARLRRRIGTELMASRARISRSTLAKVESGDPGASMGAYVGVINALGLLPQLQALANAANDEIAARLDDGRLPMRIRKKSHGS